MRRLPSSLNYANVAATVALFFAVGGGGALAIAPPSRTTHRVAIGSGRGHRGPRGPRGPRGFRGRQGKSGSCRGCTATGPQGPKGDAGPAGAAGKTGATGPAGAPNPDAADSAKLGGIPATGYVQNSCGATDGAIKGFVEVDASASFPAAPTPVAGYNCSGQDIEVSRDGTGIYIVDFLDSPVELAVGTSLGDDDSFDPGFVISIVSLGPGTFQVYVADPRSLTYDDVPFDLVTP